jgi:hypothetical protein
MRLLLRLGRILPALVCFAGPLVAQNPPPDFDRYVTLRADAYATFALDHEGGIERLRMAPSSPAVDFSFDFQDLDLRPVASDSVAAR